MTQEPLAYVFDDIDMRKLRAVMDRLYSDKPLTVDQRRDLANVLFAVLQSATPMES